MSMSCSFHPIMHYALLWLVNALPAIFISFTLVSTYPLHSDGEVPQEVAEHTFLTESLFKLNLNDPLSS